MRRPAETSVAVGEAKEAFACRYLEERGLSLVARNYRCRGGELDLVMRDGDCLAFVEVRFRRNQAFGAPAETVTRAKQRRILNAARHYLQRYPTPLDCRFDVLAITGASGVEWFKNAFGDD
jgi:putative endonuclease